jgi:hypothetical protein
MGEKHMRDVVLAVLACAIALPTTASAQKRVTLEETLKTYYVKTKPVKQRRRLSPDRLDLQRAQHLLGDCGSQVTPFRSIS